MKNNKFVQVHGPFIANKEVVDSIKVNYPNFTSIKHLGVQSPYTHICCINGQDFIIDKLEILEFNDVNINSIYFKQNEPITTLIDCILE